MPPDSEDSTPRAGLFVRLLLPLFPLFCFPLFNFSFSSLALVRPNRTPMMCTSLNVYTHNAWGLLLQKLFIIFRASSSPHMCPFLICTFSSPLYASLWLKFLLSWVAWLLCLCPTFLFVRLGHKRSTSAIVKAGSSGRVPQTGWSRKLAFLREYSVGELRMFLHSLKYEPPDVKYPVIFQSQFGHAH